MTKKSNLLFGMTAAAVVAGLLVAPIAEAQSGNRGGGAPGQGALSFAELDFDGSGGITAADLEAVQARRFARLDTDGNGSVTAAELNAFGSARSAEGMSDRTAKLIERFDSNGDGVLSAAEMQARGQAGGRGGLIEMADTNGDGAVSEAEFDAAMANMKRRGGGGGHGQRGG